MKYKIIIILKLTNAFINISTQMSVSLNELV
jgi:hypothetical protein